MSAGVELTSFRSAELLGKAEVAAARLTTSVPLHPDTDSAVSALAQHAAAMAVGSEDMGHVYRRHGLRGLSYTAELDRRAQLAYDAARTAAYRHMVRARASAARFTVSKRDT